MLNSACILVARPYLYGLMIGGQDGVEEVIKNTLADLEISMGLVGFTGIDEIIGSRDKVLLHASKL